MARLIDFELDVGTVSIRRDPKKSTIWSTWHIYKAMNDIMNDNSPAELLQWRDSTIVRTAT